MKYLTSLLLLLALCGATSQCSATPHSDPASATSEATTAETEAADSDSNEVDSEASEAPADTLPARKTGYKVVDYPTPNYDREKVNTVEGVILHHTAEPTIERSLHVLTVGKRHVGTHVVIDTDGTRYVMCRPEVVTYHAGYSVLNGKVGCNNFTIGIEFQGNTLEHPLTDDQIQSAIEYLLPIMAKYRIPLRNVVTHEMVRKAYMKRFPKRRVSGKVDITPTEYYRVMKQLTKAYNEQQKEQ